jgi:hypothetical protein
MARRLLRRFVASRNGSVILETAIMITILLMLVFGIVDMGRALYTENNLVSAAREGGRFGATYQGLFTVPSSPDTLAVKDATIARFSPFGGTALTRAMITTSLLGTGGNFGFTSIRVSIAYPFTWVTPIQRLVGSLRSTMHSQAEFRLEQ